MNNAVAKPEVRHGLVREPDRLGSDSCEQCLDRGVRIPMAMSVARIWREERYFA